MSKQPAPQNRESPTTTFVVGVIVIKAISGGVLPALQRTLAAPETKQKPPDVPWNRLLSQVLVWLVVVGLIAGSVSLVGVFDEGAAWTYALVMLLLMVLYDWKAIEAFLQQMGVR